MNKVSLDKNDSSEYNNYTQFGYNDYRTNFDDRYGRQERDKPIKADLLSMHKKDKMDHYVGSDEKYGSKIHLNLSDKKGGSFEITPALLDKLPYNGSGSQWYGDENPDYKRFKRLSEISSLCIYGGTAVGVCICVFAKASFLFRGSHEPFDSLLSVILILVGIAAFYLNNKATMKRIKSCTLEVNGLIVGYDKSYSTDSDDHSSATYTPIFGYNYNGQIYTVKGTLYSSGVPKVGEEVKLYVDPNLPTRYFQPGHDRSGFIFIIVFSSIFIIVGIITAFAK